jgi:hypothetical protein
LKSKARLEAFRKAAELPGAGADKGQQGESKGS